MLVNKFYLLCASRALMCATFSAILAAKSSVFTRQRSNWIFGFFNGSLRCKESLNRATTSALIERSLLFAKAFSCVSKSSGKRSVNLAKSVWAFIGIKAHQCFKSDVNLMSLFCQKRDSFVRRFNVTIILSALMASSAYSHPPNVVIVENPNTINNQLSAPSVFLFPLHI